MPIRLPDPQILELQGADAAAFAQAQFASDVSVLDAGDWQWSAWLSAQGRVRAFFQLLRADAGRLLLLLRGGSAQRLRDSLARYVLRAKVTLRVVDDMCVFATAHPANIGNMPQPSTTARASSADGCIWIAMPGSAPSWLLLAMRTCPIAADDSPAARNLLALADIDAGIVTLDEKLEDQLLPDWIGLTELGAISVRKGCYPGQEVVARLHFRGGNKRWLHRIGFVADRLPAPASWLPAEGENAAQVICSAWRGEGDGRALVAMRDTAGANLLSGLEEGISVSKIERVRFASTTG